MRALLWDVHGAYTDALLGCPVDFCFARADADTDERPGSATDPAAPGFGRRAVRPGERVAEVPVQSLRDDPPDVVIAQRIEDVAAAESILGDRLGRSVGRGRVGAVYLEHNTPRAEVPTSRHPLADRPGWTIVHVTHFNALMWDCGDSPTRVIEHGLPDPGHRYRGIEERLAFVVNEPVRRWRVTGTDLLPRFADFGVDAFGIDGDRLPAALGGACPRLRFAGNLSTGELHAELVSRRAYLHLNRWTSLGLSLIEAMLLGLPVIVIDSTEAARAVPQAAGARSSDPDELVGAARRLLADPEESFARGFRARAHALDRYAYERFLGDWTRCLHEVAPRRG